MTDTLSTPKTKRQRSRNFPVIGLEKSIEKAQTLKEAEGSNFTATGIVTQHWGFASNSSNGMRVIAALVQFGLLEESGGKRESRRVSVSQLARTILDSPDPQEKNAAIQEAALRPTLYKETWEIYQDGIPTDKSMRWDLTGKGDPSKGVLSDNAADTFIRSFRDTLIFAGLIEGDTVESKTAPEAKSTPDNVTKNVSKPSEKGSSMQSAVTLIQPDFNLPIPLGAGQKGHLILPSPMTAQQWERLLAGFESAKQLKTFLVEEPTQESKIESEDS